MKTLAMSPELTAFCEKHDLYEYGVTFIVTMPNGFQFTTQDENLAVSFKVGANTKATVQTIVELGE